MDGGKLIIRTRLIERLNKELKRKKIVYFGASMGWGKTTAQTIIAIVMFPRVRAIGTTPFLTPRKAERSIL